MLKRLLKWTLILVIAVVVLAVIFFLSLDTILRLTIEHNIRKQTGMEAEIGKFHFGLTEGVVEIKNLQLYNPPAFGGTPFLNIPEIHVEYDRAALASRVVHITLLRFDLGELDVVKSRDGQTNLLSLGLTLPAQKSAPGSSRAAPQLADLKRQLNVDFQGIDCLNVSVGTFKYVDLQDQKNNREQKIGVENCVITNVTSAADLAGLGLVVGLRSDDFFRPLVDPNASSASPRELLKMFGH